MIKKTILLVVAAYLVLGAGSCETDVPVADRQQAKQTATMMEEAQRQAPLPNIVNWTERKNAKALYELRDQANLVTYTYTVNLNGDKIFLCNSLGFGLPQSVQYSNPLRVVQDYTQSFGTLPQPEPNGLFMPEGLAATWVYCVDPTTGKPAPTYVEPEIIVSTFKMK